MEVDMRAGKVQMMSCESAEVRRQTFGLTEENRVAGGSWRLKGSVVGQYSPVAATPEVVLEEAVDQIPNAEEGKD